MRSSHDAAGGTTTRLGLMKLVMFQIVWLSCAIGAGQGWRWPGILAAALLVLLHLATAPRWKHAAMILLAAGTLGFLVETSLQGTGLLQYSSLWPTQTLAPVWVVALWLAFGTTLGSTLRLLGSNPLSKSILLGLIFGPSSYLAGERLGALKFGPFPWRGYLAVAVLWAVVYPGLLAMEAWLIRSSRSHPTQH
jgi:hypothetical protein